MNRLGSCLGPLRAAWFIWPLFVGLLSSEAAAQADSTRTPLSPFFLGEEKRLQMVVHVLGEVQRPGEYAVSDDTDVLELISKAGGATEFANLGGLKVKRRSSVAAAGMTPDPEGRVVSVDLSKYLESEDGAPPPFLQPGDVVTVPRNRMSMWRTTFTMVRDVTAVVSTYLLYRRVVEN